jgi:beta-xylosidase
MTVIHQSVIPNPIIPGFNPDPTVCRVGDDYFLATSTFEYFPGVPIYHSRDLVNWTVIGHALNRPSQLEMRRVDPGGGIYAPSLRYHKGRFYLSTCCVYSRAGLLVSLPVYQVRTWSNFQLNEARGFYVSTDNIFDETTWSEPVYFDSLGIDQDVSRAVIDQVYFH